MVQTMSSLFGVGFLSLSTLDKVSPRKEKPNLINGGFSTAYTAPREARCEPRALLDKNIYFYIIYIYK